MHLGIDVGGTHTDGALLNERLAIAATAKTATLPDDVLGSIKTVLASLLAGRDSEMVERLVVSSTVGLNAVLTGRADPVGVLACGGPGLQPDLSGQPLAALLSGSMDHRGEILDPLAPGEAEAAAGRLASQGARAFAVISKFGPKNLEFEKIMAEAAAAAAPEAPVTRASQLSGRLNFPRRLNTAVLNSAVMRLYDEFAWGLKQAAAEAGLHCPISLLTADGGVEDLFTAAKNPAAVVAAGPAAGLLGLWSQAELSGDALMVDMGGTSTDLAVMADGEPLMTAEGLTIAGRPTLVRAFLTHSVALGGDSVLSLTRDGGVLAGPARLGPALALCPEDLGRRPATFTDALNVLGLTSVGDTEISHRALNLLAPGEAETLARSAFESALAALKAGFDELMFLVNNRPVYTLDAMRLDRPLKPRRGAMLGGPAEALAEAAADCLGLPVKVPEHAGVTNAIGAARARPAAMAELYADTALGRMTIPSLGLTRAVDRTYNIKLAERDLLEALAAELKNKPELGLPRITESESFNQLAGYGRSDKIIRLRAQARPGYISSGGGF